MSTARLVFADGSACEVARARPQDDWVGDVACPICGASPIRVLAYSDDPPAPSAPRLHDGSGVVFGAARVGGLPQDGGRQGAAAPDERGARGDVSVSNLWMREVP